MLGPLLSDFADLDIAAQHVVYADEATNEVRDELSELDGVVVWVNPIQDGANRAQLDALLREVADAGVFVSAHPEIIDKMGTKEVLFVTRGLGWGTDTAIYRSVQEFAQTFPVRLAQHRRLVVKQARGNGGNGVWRVELPAGSPGGVPDPNASVLVQRSEPRTVTPLEETTLGALCENCAAYFAWSGCLIDQLYADRLAEGMIRVYLVHDEVVGFCHQYPRGLITPGTDSDTASLVRPAMEDPDTAVYASLRTQTESEWVPGMRDLLGISTHDLPVIWDADFLYGPKNESGEDTYILCEINVQAVWPYPRQASKQLVAAAAERVLEAKSART
jgi:hypothetical protein